MSCPSGPAPELTVAQVLKVFLPEYLDRHLLPAHHLKVLRRLARVAPANWAGRYGNASSAIAPIGGLMAAATATAPLASISAPPWLQHQRRALLPVRYFHWVFTLPAALRPLILQNPAPLYSLLFESASATLLQFGQQHFRPNWASRPSSIPGARTS